MKPTPNGPMLLSTETFFFNRATTARRDRRTWFMFLCICALLLTGCMADRGFQVVPEGKVDIKNRTLAGLVSVNPLRITGDSKTAISVVEGRVWLQPQKNGLPDGEPIIVQAGGKIYLDELRRVDPEENPEEVDALLAFLFPEGVPDHFKP